MGSMSATRARVDAWKGVHDLTSITLKCMALNAAFVPDKDLYPFVSNMKAPTDYELSGTGYARQTLGSKSVADDGSSHMKFDAADTVFTGINAGTIGTLVIYRDRGGSDSANEVLFMIDPTDLITNGGTVTVVWNSQGIYLY